MLFSLVLRRFLPLCLAVLLPLLPALSDTKVKLAYDKPGNFNNTTPLDGKWQCRVTRPAYLIYRDSKTRAYLAFSSVGSNKIKSQNIKNQVNKLLSQHYKKSGLSKTTKSKITKSLKNFLSTKGQKKFAAIYNQAYARSLVCQPPSTLPPTVPPTEPPASVSPSPSPVPLPEILAYVKTISDPALRPLTQGEVLSGIVDLYFGTLNLDFVTLFINGVEFISGPLIELKDINLNTVPAGPITLKVATSGVFREWQIVIAHTTPEPPPTISPTPTPIDASIMFLSPMPGGSFITGQDTIIFTLESNRPGSSIRINTVGMTILSGTADSNGRMTASISLQGLSLPAGAYTLTAELLDSDGNMAATSTRTINLLPQPSAPTTGEIVETLVAEAIVDDELGSSPIPNATKQIMVYFNPEDQVNRNTHTLAVTSSDGTPVQYVAVPELFHGTASSAFVKAFRLTVRLVAPLAVGAPRQLFVRLVPYVANPLSSGPTLSQIAATGINASLSLKGSYLITNNQINFDETKTFQQLIQSNKCTLSNSNGLMALIMCKGFNYGGAIAPFSGVFYIEYYVGANTAKIIALASHHDIAKIASQNVIERIGLFGSSGEVIDLQNWNTNATINGYQKIGRHMQFATSWATYGYLLSDLARSFDMRFWLKRDPDLLASKKVLPEGMYKLDFRGPSQSAYDAEFLRAQYEEFKSEPSGFAIPKNTILNLTGAGYNPRHTTGTLSGYGRLAAASLFHPLAVNIAFVSELQNLSAPYAATSSQSNLVLTEDGVTNINQALIFPSITAYSNPNLHLNYMQASNINTLISSPYVGQARNGFAATADSAFALPVRRDATFSLESHERVSNPTHLAPVGSIFATVFGNKLSLDTSIAQSQFFALQPNPSDRGGSGRYYAFVGSSIAPRAWRLFSQVAQLLYIMPDSHPMKNELKRIVMDNICERLGAYNLAQIPGADARCNATRIIGQNIKQFSNAEAPGAYLAGNIPGSRKFSYFGLVAGGREYVDGVQSGFTAEQFYNLINTFLPGTTIINRYNETTSNNLFSAPYNIGAGSINYHPGPYPVGIPYRTAKTAETGFMWWIMMAAIKDIHQKVIPVPQLLSLGAEYLEFLWQVERHDQDVLGNTRHNALSSIGCYRQPTAFVNLNGGVQHVTTPGEYLSAMHPKARQLLFNPSTGDEPECGSWYGYVALSVGNFGDYLQYTNLSAADRQSFAAALNVVRQNEINIMAGTGSPSEIEKVVYFGRAGEGPYLGID